MADVTNATSNIVQSLGAGSGMDTAAIIDALVAAEQAPKEAQIQGSIDQSNASISGLGILKSTLTSFSESLSDLKSAAFYRTQTNVAAKTTAFTVKAEGEAIPGAYDVTVQQLASNQITVLYDQMVGGERVGYSSLDQTLNGGGSFNIDVAVGSETTSVFVENATVQGVIDALNDAGLGLSARSLHTGGASGTYQIAISGGTGAENAFTLTSSVFQQQDLRSSSDAQLTVDGVSVTRSNNVVDDVIPGATIELFNTEATSVTVNVTRDTDSIKSTIESMVEIYNSAKAVFDALGDRSETDEDGTGSLAGNSLLRTLIARMRSQMLDIPVGLNGDVSMLSQVGIEFNLKGQLEIDEDALNNALNNNFDGLTQFFSGAETDSESTGFAGELSDLIDTFVEADSGQIDRQVATFESRNERFEEQLARLELRMESLRARYVTQFTAMETIVGQFNTLKDSLKTQFENMPFTSKN